jgi:thiol-disulfide isomerase/thioredoxin
MIRISWLLCVLIGLAVFAGHSRGQTSQPASDNSDAQAMLDAFHALQPPQPDMSRKDDEQYVQSFMKQRDDFLAKAADMAKQFYDKYPDNPQAMDLMQHRWIILAQTGRGSVANEETAQFLGKNPDAQTRADLLFIRAAIALNSVSDSPSGPIEEFLKAAPTDDRGAELLLAEGRREEAPDKQLALYRRVVSSYPASQSADMAKGLIRQREGIGQPFDLNFTDAISGKAISVQKDLKGKIVVIDFWATWCGPCVEQMPDNKSLYDAYKDKGVEFIGVSLDEPEAQAGLMNLKHFVAVNGINWPQYYQGNAWDSEFSSSWGIKATGIPTVFIVDADGKLYSTEAVAELHKLIPELLAKRDNSATAH